MTTAGYSPDQSRLASPTTLSIDCDECVLQHSEACADCVVTFLCGREGAAPVVVDLAEARAMRLLDDAGLAPPLRHQARHKSFG